VRRLAQETGISKSSATRATRRWISTYLTGTENVCVCKDIIFSASNKRFSLFDCLLWNDIWLVSGKSCIIWWWVMQFLPGAGKWQLRVTVSERTV
jgi:hypothetical protein